MADTAALVVALSAQLTKFEKDLAKAGVIAEKEVKNIEDKFSKMNPRVGPSFLGNFFADLAGKGLDAAVAAVKDFVEEFKRLESAANLAEISVGQVYAISQSLGKNSEANTAFIEKMTIALDEARRGQENAFTDLKKTNPDFFKNMGKDTFDVAENVARVAEMTKQAASNVEKWKIVEQAGGARVLVKELEKGGEHSRTMVKEAQETGNQIARAAAEAKALEAAMINAFTGFVKSAMQEFWKDNANLLQQAKYGLQTLRDWSKNTWKPVEEGAGKAADAVEEITGEHGRGGMLGPSFADRWILRLNDLQTEIKKAGEAAVKADQKATGKGTATATKGAPLARSTPKATGGGGEEGAFERANQQVTKHIVLMKADAAAVGASAGEHERLRTEAILLTAAEKQYGTVSDKVREQIKAQGEEAKRAAQLRADALKNFGELSAMSSQFGSLLSSSFSDAIVEGKALNDVFKDLTKSLLKMAINTTIMNLFNPGAGGQASPFLSLFGVGKNAGGTDNWRGGMTMVGEHGPELVNLPRGSQVVPADATRNMMNGGGGSITYAPAIDARGASVEAVARLARIIETDRAMFASRTVATIQQARRARVAGL